MRTHKGFYVLIALAFILQACGNAGATPAAPPAVTETLPVATLPPVTEPIITTMPGEFFFIHPFQVRSWFSWALVGTVFH